METCARMIKDIREFPRRIDLRKKKPTRSAGNRLTGADAPLPRVPVSPSATGRRRMSALFGPRSDDAGHGRPLVRRQKDPRSLAEHFAHLAHYAVKLGDPVLMPGRVGFIGSGSQRTQTPSPVVGPVGCPRVGPGLCKWFE